MWLERCVEYEELLTNANYGNDFVNEDLPFWDGWGAGVRGPIPVSYTGAWTLLCSTTVEESSVVSLRGHFLIRDAKCFDLGRKLFHLKF